MYLADHEIKVLLEEMEITGPNPEHQFDPQRQIQPCSIDLAISNEFWRPSRRRKLSRLLPGRDLAVDIRRSEVHDLDRLRDWKRIKVAEGQSLTIKPGQIVMGRIYERFRIPTGYAGKIEGRSSFARLGLLVHCTGDFINPGWGGYMPLQLVNLGPYPLRLAPYFEICQLMIVRLSSEPERTYGDDELKSKYANDDGGPSSWWRDERVRELQGRLGSFSASEAIRQQIISTVRFQDPEVLVRFQRYLDRRRVGQITNADEILYNFAQREGWRRLADTSAVGALPICFAGLLGSLFLLTSSSFGWVQIVLIVVTLVSGVLALAAWVRRGSGYLDRPQLRTLKERSEGGGSS